jgi:hypothetical protein
MKTLSEADYNAVIRLLTAVASGALLDANKRRIASLLIKKSKRKYGK